MDLNLTHRYLNEPLEIKLQSRVNIVSWQKKSVSYRNQWLNLFGVLATWWRHGRSLYRRRWLVQVVLQHILFQNGVSECKYQTKKMMEINNEINETKNTTNHVSCWVFCCLQIPNAVHIITSYASIEIDGSVLKYCNK